MSKLERINHAATTHIGRQIRKWRTLRGMSQEDLAKHMGLSYQQVQKYETGTNHMNPDRILAACQVLHVGIEDIFPPVSGVVPAPELDFDLGRGELELITNMNKIAPHIKQTLRKLVAQMAGEP